MANFGGWDWEKVKVSYQSGDSKSGFDDVEAMGALKMEPLETGVYFDFSLKRFCSSYTCRCLACSIWFN